MKAPADTIHRAKQRLRIRRWSLLRWLSQRLAVSTPAHPRYPIVLVHGLCGFGELRVRGKRLQYFRGVPGRLSALGVEVHVVDLPKVASVMSRAERLTAFVSSLGSTRVNLIAHSMGGLDARYAITKLGLGNRVASLTTIGTPHRGSPLVDSGTELVGVNSAVQRLCRWMGADLQALQDLTTDHLRQFNAEIHDDPRVLYACVVGRIPSRSRPNNPMLRPTHHFLLSGCGDNDGLVPTSSQVWGRVLAIADADHWAQIGWSVPGDGFDAPELFARVAQQLALLGV